jgi:prophage maintenance system killer protein
VERHIIPLHDQDGRKIWYDSTEKIETLAAHIDSVSSDALFRAASQKHRVAFLNKAFLNDARCSALLDKGGKFRSSLSCAGFAADICGQDLNEQTVMKLYRLMSRNDLSRSITGLHKVDGIIEFIDFYNYYECGPLEKSCIIYYYFEKVHPLHDSSGRMGRLLVLMWLLRNGYEFARYCPVSQMIFHNRKELETAMECSSGAEGITGLIEAMLKSYAEGIDTLAKMNVSADKTIS